jgi:mannose-6-phosphate isomerase-like protein (cupin superfamily)
LRASKSELTVLVEAGDASIRGVEWAGMQVAIISVPAGTDFGPLLKGLPNDRCPSPHWGYVLKGRLRVEQGGTEEVLHVGDAFYAGAGHTAVADEDTEFLEISPSDRFQEALRGVLRNVAAP